MNVAVAENIHAGGEQVARQAVRQRRWRLAGGALAGMALLGWASYWYPDGQYLQSTEDAYVRADWVTVSSRVSGYVAGVQVQDDQRVKAGDVLVRLQNRDYQALHDQAQAQVEAARSSLLAAQAAWQVATERVEQQHQAVLQAEATIGSATAEDQRSELDQQRYRRLVHDNAATLQRLETANASVGQARATLQSAQARLREQQVLLVMARAQVQLAQAQIQQQIAANASAVASLALAEQNLGDTLIRAPIDGVVGQRRVRAGQYTVPGQPLLAVVPVQHSYVVANYKETQLAHMQPGQPVSIRVDSFSGPALHGRLASFSPGSGNVFALLPSDNATGNFTKIVQRFPVRILLDAPADSRLIPGMSVVTTVDTRPVQARHEQ